MFNLQNLYQQPLAILQILGILLASYATCTLLDFIRQALFAVTIGKRRGHWFDLLWDKASTQSILSPEHASQSVVPEKLRTLDRGRPWRDSQFASTRLSPSRDMSR